LAPIRVLSGRLFVRIPATDSGVIDLPNVYERTAAHISEPSA